MLVITEKIMKRPVYYVLSVKNPTFFNCWYDILMYKESSL